MMHFNSDNILAGYIKQLLSSFNLPMCRVFKDEDDVLSYIKVGDKYYTEAYIKDEKIQVGEKTSNGIYWNEKGAYSYNKHKSNLTKKFPIKNGIYDTYTHEYLGDYLRFQRDYNQINLMPLYNCFSGKLCPKLYFNTGFVDNSDGKGSGSKTTVIFNTSDDQYQLYMMPVKLFQKYTIAIDSNAPVELFCGLYNTKFWTPSDDENFSKRLFKNTYIKYGALKFNQPVLYEKLFDAIYREGGKIVDDADIVGRNLNKTLLRYEEDLKLFIRLPIRNKSSITILEGDYIKYCDYGIKNDISGTTVVEGTEYINHDFNKKHYEIIKNKFVVNHEHEEVYKLFKPITSLQLLRMNTGVSYPFSDRLIEYLTGNAISKVEEYSDNIQRIQTVLKKNNVNYVNYGLWEDNIPCRLYDFMNNETYSNKYDINKDILGYCDKDVEQIYSCRSFSQQTMDEAISIANVDIYGNEV